MRLRERVNYEILRKRDRELGSPLINLNNLESPPPRKMTREQRAEIYTIARINSETLAPE